MKIRKPLASLMFCIFAYNSYAETNNVQQQLECANIAQISQNVQSGRQEGVTLEDLSKYVEVNRDAHPELLYNLSVASHVYLKIPEDIPPEVVYENVLDVCLRPLFEPKYKGIEYNV